MLCKLLLCCIVKEIMTKRKFLPMFSTDAACFSAHFWSMTGWICSCRPCGHRAPTPLAMFTGDETQSPWSRVQRQWDHLGSSFSVFEIHRLCGPTLIITYWCPSWWPLGSPAPFNVQLSWPEIFPHVSVKDRGKGGSWGEGHRDPIPLISYRSCSPS